MSEKLLVTFSPHIKDNVTTSKIMLNVVIALVPAMIVSIYFFGYYAVRTYVFSVFFTLLFEYLFLKIRKKEVTLSDNSALVTAILLAMNLPPSSPWWMIAVGSFVAIVIGKQIYGGLGQNIFNPALVARVFLLISWPAQMTYWIKPTPATKGFFLDAVSAATPLGQSKAEIISSGKITGVYNDIIGYATGYMAGSLGEVSAIALVTGGIYLLAKRIITWHIPLSYLAGFFAIVVPSWLIAPEKTLSPVIHLFTGGLMLGVFFMATDMVTSPVSKKGQIIFGLGCGILTAVIRLFGSYPEGVSFAILIMNAVVPLIDYYMRPESFGEVRGEK